MSYEIANLNPTEVAESKMTNNSLCDSKNVELIDFSEWISYLYNDNEDKDIQDITVYLYINKCVESDGIKKQYFLLRPDADFVMKDETIKLRNRTTVNENDEQLNYLLYEINIATFNTNTNAKNLKWTDNVYDYLKYNETVYFVIEDGVNVIPDYISDSVVESVQGSDQGSGQGSDQGSDEGSVFGSTSERVNEHEQTISTYDSDSSKSLMLDPLYDISVSEKGSKKESEKGSEEESGQGSEEESEEESDEESVFGSRSEPLHKYEHTISTYDSNLSPPFV